MSHFGNILKWLRDEYGIRLSGVLHIGANLGQEAADYDAVGCNVIWIEGDPEVFGQLQPALAGYPNQQAYCCLCSNVDGQAVPFHVTSNEGGSSSVLPPNDAALARLGVQVIATRKLTACRLDTYFARHDISLDGYNLINIDIQGYELPALQGLGDLLDGFDVVISELHWATTYAGATKPYALESFFVRRGFRRLWMGVNDPEATGIWVRGTAGPVTRLYMALSVRIYFIAVRCGLVKWLRCSGILQRGRRWYCAVKRRKW